MSFNRWCGIGRLGKDPDMQYTNSGMPYTKFSVATTEKYKNEEKTQWHNIVAWDKRAELCSKYLVKGSLVYVEGRLEYNQYEKDGQKQYFTQIVLDQIRFLSTGKKDNQQGQQNPTQRNMPINNNPIDDSDIPF